MLDDYLVMQSGTGGRHVYIGIAVNRRTARVLQPIERAGRNAEDLGLLLPLDDSFRAG